ncbi:DUF2550 domain-containing protein [Actinacidiphila guanduensis]|jgi:hypothetical protein|uniref:DUF2550 family protein n=1 Tax=Actinacidiphila guanduensis TaxID=310781 RepID=A0A1G9ZE29_9ACTN|nr:DUF2550 domain-containing protein [Actinacidiphila guanduensis]SDN19700.1 Protein of unknown function [Actinacidiphila guanduensis]
MVLAFEVVGAVLVVAVAGLFLFGLRRRLIQRPGGTFDCSLRPAPADEADAGGKGWVYGVARYSGDRLEWFRVFSYAFRPRRVLERPAIEVLGRRLPQGSEELALLSDAVVLSCLHRGTRLELAMSDDALTGFLAWLEAAPPGQRVNVA